MPSAYHELALALFLFGGVVVSAQHMKKPNKTVIVWSQGADVALPKGGYASGVVNGRLILAGGTYWKNGQKLWLDEVVAYDLKQDRWDSLTSLPKPLASTAGATRNGEFYLLGGAGAELAEEAGYRLVHKVESYSWEKFTTLPTPFCSGRAEIVGDTLYIIGGAKHPTKLETASASVWALSLSGQSSSWKSVAQMPGQGRALFASTVHEGKIYVFGGMSGDAKGQRVNLQSAYQYSPSSNQWRSLKDPPTATRAWSASSSDRRYIFLFGGYSTPLDGLPGSFSRGKFESRVWRYDTVQDDYQEVEPLPHAVCDVSFYLFNRAFYGAAGEPGPGARAPWTFIGNIE